VKPREFRRDTASLNDFGVVAVTRGTGTLFYGIDLNGPLVKPGVPYCTFDVPYARLVMLALVLPLARLVARVIRTLASERRDARLCPACGYDLRGNESGVCPECGGVATGVAAGHLDDIAGSSEPPLPPLWQRATAWFLVLLAAGMIILAAWPDLRRVLHISL
jgi:hypothetical protein